MSLENVEALRALLEPTSGTSWDEGALSEWESSATLFDPNVVYEDATMFDETFHGPDGVAEAFRRWNEAFASTRLELLEILGDGDTLVSIHRFQTTAHHTGIEFKGEFAYVWTFRDGKVVHYRSTDREQALKAVGGEE